MKQQLTDKQKTIIAGIIAAKTRVLLDQEAIKDDTAALAVELGMKPSDVSAMITTVMQDQAKGGVIEKKGRILDLAAQVAGIDTDQESLTLEESEQVKLFPSVDSVDLFYVDAKRIVLQSGNTSIAHLQRVLKIGYNRAARLIEQMEQEGLVSPMNPAGERHVAPGAKQ